MKIFVTISTGLQLINAIEFLNTLDIKQMKVHFFISTDGIERENAIKQVFDDYSAFLPLFKSSYIRQRHSKYILVAYFLQLIKNIKSKMILYKLIKGNTYDIHVCGNFVALEQRYAMNISCAKTKVCVDDGMVAIRYFNFRHNSCLRRHNIDWLVFGKTFDVNDRITFYSSFIDKVDKIDELIINNYSCTKRLKNDYDIKDSETVFIGQPLYKEFGINKYLSILKDVCAIFGVKKLTYYLHPNENGELYAACDYIETVRLSSPIEVYLVNSSSKSVIAGFYTSVLITAKRLVPQNKVCAVDISSLLPWLKDSYRYFKDNNINVVDLNQNL